MAFIGNGTYGKVYVNKEDSTKVVKIIKRYEASQFETEEHLLRLSSNNAHIAKVFKVETDVNSIYIHMTRYDGDLQKFILDIQSTLSLDMVMRLENQIGSALKYLHRDQRILHADVKPDNILLDITCNFYLCDFSLSMDLDHESLVTTNQIYSDQYRPPILYYNTQIRDGNKIKEEYDFYALFMTLCFAYEQFVLVDDYSQIDEIVKCFWNFKLREFPKLLEKDFNTMIYKDMYLRTFQLCY